MDRSQTRQCARYGARLYAQHSLRLEFGVIQHRFEPWAFVSQESLSHLVRIRRRKNEALTRFITLPGCRAVQRIRIRSARPYGREQPRRRLSRQHERREFRLNASDGHRSATFEEHEVVRQNPKADRNACTAVLRWIQE